MGNWVSPTVWRQARDRADKDRKLLIRAWWLGLSLILLVAVIFHVLAADVLPWMFGLAVLLGIGCWMLALALAQLNYWFVSRLAKRSSIQSEGPTETGR